VELIFRAFFTSYKGVFFSLCLIETRDVKADNHFLNPNFYIIFESLIIKTKVHKCSHYNFMELI